MAKASTSFKPGESGNPNGRPKKGCTKRDFYLAYFEECDPGEKKTRIEKVLESYKENAAKGDQTIQRHIIDQVYGKAKETIDTNLNQPINVIIKGMGKRNDKPNG